MSTSDKASENSVKVYIFGSIIALIGALLSAYALFHHIEVRATGATNAACNISDTFNCDDVAKSEYAEILGFPMGIYGVGYFLGLLILLGTAFFKKEFEHDNLQTYKALCILGFAISVGLFFLSWTKVGAFCPTCIGVYSICTLQALFVWAQRHHLPQGFSSKGLSNGATYPIAALAACAIIYSFAKPTPRNFRQDLPQMDISPNEAENQTILDLTTHDIPLATSAYSGLGEDYRQGGSQAKVVITEFADFECPACRHAFQTLKQIKATFGDQVLVVFRNFPLDKACNPSISRNIHEYACEAAVMARCAGRIGKFWPMHDKIFANQAQLSSSILTEWAQELGLSDSQISECKGSQDILEKIKQDIKVGEKVGVTGTPALFINGRKVVGGRNYETLRSYISQKLNE